MAWDEKTRDRVHAWLESPGKLILNTDDIRAALDEIERLERMKPCHHGWRGSSAERITTPCPTCGLASLFIGKGGHLTCASVPSGNSHGCPQPGVEKAVELLKARVEAAEQRIAKLEKELQEQRARADRLAEEAEVRVANAGLSDLQVFRERRVLGNYIPRSFDESLRTLARDSEQQQQRIATLEQHHDDYHAYCSAVRSGGPRMSEPEEPCDCGCYEREEPDSLTCICRAERDAEVKRLREALAAMVKKWASHSGLCCRFKPEVGVVVTTETCVCDPMHKEARAALAQPGGRE